MVYMKPKMLMKTHLDEFDEIKKLWFSDENPLDTRFFELGEFTSLTPVNRFLISIICNVDVERHEIDEISELLGLTLVRIKYDDKYQSIVMTLEGS